MHVLQSTTYIASTTRSYEFPKTDSYLALDSELFLSPIGHNSHMVSILHTKGSYVKCYSRKKLMEKTYRRNVVTVGPPISNLRDFSKSASIFTTCVAYRIEVCIYLLRFRRNNYAIESSAEERLLAAWCKCHP